MDPGAKSRFENAADVLGLDVETRDKAWRRIADLGMTPDDPTVIYLAVAGVLEKAATEIPRAIASVPARVEEAAKRAVGSVAEAAMIAARASVADSAELVVEGAKADIRAAAVRTLNAAAARETAKTSFLTIATTLMIAVVALGIGYGLGRADGAAIDRRWQALSLRPDASSWLDLISANGDLAKTLRESCGAGAKPAYTVQGTRACSVPLWLEGAPGPVAGADEVGLVTIVDWLTKWSAAIAVVAGVLAGVFLRKILFALGSRTSVQWLLDL